MFVFSTSAGDALLIGFAQVGNAALVGACTHTFAIHRRPRQERCLGNGELLQDSCKVKSHTQELKGQASLLSWSPED